MSDNREMKKHIGIQIRNARHEKGMSGDHLASLLGVTPSYVRHMEYGVKLPSTQLLIKVCQALSISPVYLLAPYVRDMQNQYDPEFWTRYMSLTETQKNKLIILMDVIFGLRPVSLTQKQHIMAILDILLDDDAATADGKSFRSGDEDNVLPEDVEDKLLENS